MIDFMIYKMRRNFLLCGGYCLLFLGSCLLLRVTLWKPVALLCLTAAFLSVWKFSCILLGFAAGALFASKGYGVKEVELTARRARRLPFAENIAEEDRKHLESFGGRAVVTTVPFVGKCVTEVYK